MIETHRAFVNTWECDENAHMNVLFYWKRFGEAGRIFAKQSDVTNEPWVDRHVRYHRELGAGSPTVVKSQATRDHVIHLLSNGDDGSISASALDQFSTGGMVDELPESVGPRSLPLQPLEPVKAEAKTADGLGLISHMSCVTPAECDQHGVLLDQFHIARFSDAAAHLWGYFGIKRSWMHDNNYGSAAVEMKVTRHAQVKTGMMIQITTWLEEARSKTFSFRHQVSDMETGSVLYSGAVTALIMDLSTRKALPVPEQIAALR